MRVWKNADRHHFFQSYDGAWSRIWKSDFSTRTKIWADDLGGLCPRTNRFCPWPTHFVTVRDSTLCAMLLDDFKFGWGCGVFQTCICPLRKTVWKVCHSPKFSFDPTTPLSADKLYDHKKRKWTSTHWGEVAPERWTHLEGIRGEFWYFLPMNHVLKEDSSTGSWCPWFHKELLAIDYAILASLSYLQGK